MQLDFRLDTAFFAGKTAKTLDFSSLVPGGTDDGIVTEIARRPIVYDNPLATVDYDNALDFCRAVELRPHLRHFAFVSGDFIFGDIFEAWAHLGVGFRSLTIQTLSISAENIDSLVNLATLSPTLRRVRIALSTYFWAHEHSPGGLVPYMYQELEPVVDEFDAAYAMLHTKVASFETTDGLRVVCDGSANLRSSKSFEQVRVECDDGLYGFVEEVADKLFDAYSVINDDKKRPDNTQGGQRRMWEMMHE